MRNLSIMLSALLLLAVSSLFAQTTEVAGKVTDASGAPVSGASIRIKNAKGGTSSTSDGTFKLRVAKTDILVVSSIGFESIEVPVGGQSFVNVTLTQDTKALGEVVVTGTGAATSKRKLGISVESIKSDKLPIVPAATIDQALI
ncbi:MAG: carboxypeptidase-like regulatory domain-containing protein, partial [Microcystis sp.]